MKTLKFSLILIFIINTTAYVQPQNDWVRTYDLGREDAIKDIYRMQNGDLATCGVTRDHWNHNNLSSQIWLMRLEDNGNIIWSNTYGDEDICESFWSLIEADNGDILSVGFSYSDDDYRTAAIRTDSEGEEIWRRTYNGIEFNAIIELKSGDFVMCGYDSENRNPDGLLICIDGDGEILWRRMYDFGGSEFFYSMRETDGEVVVTGDISFDDWSSVCVLKVDAEQGDIIWSRVHRLESPALGLSMVSVRDGGFAITGYSAIGRDSDFLLLTVDNQGFEEWNRSYDIEGQNTPDMSYCIARLSDQGYALAGSSNQWTNAIVLKVDAGGDLEWSRNASDIMEGQTTTLFSSVVDCIDRSVLSAGRIRVEDGDYDGLLVKFVPERSAPLIIEYHPDDTLLNVLQGDTIQFDVYAIDAQRDSMEFIWTMGEDTVSVDTFAVVVFDELGEFSVNCNVSDTTGFTEIEWDVNVQEFVIREFAPDNLDFAIRRGTSIGFSLDVDALEDLDLEYLWTIVHRNQQREEIGEDNRVSVQFDQAGEHQVQALISAPETSEEINWTINVRSAIWSWWPSDLEILAYVDSTYEFVITPFNENSDSLEYSWLFNDEQLESDSSLTIITFPEVGQNEITSIVHDGIEADTIRWTVNVEEWSFTTDLTDLTDLPSSPVLYSASPNPFNASIKLSMYLPRKNHVLLSVFDVNGREVSRLVDGTVLAGNQSVIWNASGFPAGVYVVRMKVGGVSEIRKVVLVR